jgi:membrane protein
MGGDAFQAAAAVAFWFFLSLVPLLVLAGFLIGQVARARGVDVLVAPLLEVAPATAVDLVRTELERLGGSASSIAPLGVAGFMWTASSGLHNLMDVVEQAYKATPRAWWTQRLLSLGCVALMLAAACLAAWLLVQISGALPKQPVITTPTAQRAPDREDHAAAAGKAGHAQPSPKHRPRYAFRSATYPFIAAVVTLGLGVLLLAGFFRVSVGPAPKGGRQVWPGTAFAVVSWILVSWGFGRYVGSLGNYALYYGSLATVAVTLMWLYLTSLSLVVGAYVNGALESQSQP